MSYADLMKEDDRAEAAFQKAQTAWTMATPPNPVDFKEPGNTTFTDALAVISDVLRGLYPGRMAADMGMLPAEEISTLETLIKKSENRQMVLKEWQKQLPTLRANAERVKVDAERAMAKQKAADAALAAQKAQAAKDVEAKAKMLEDAARAQQLSTAADKALADAQARKAKADAELAKGPTSVTSLFGKKITPAQTDTVEAAVAKAEQSVASLPSWLLPAGGLLAAAVGVYALTRKPSKSVAGLGGCPCDLPRKRTKGRR